MHKALSFDPEHAQSHQIEPSVGSRSGLRLVSGKGAPPSSDSCPEWGEEHSFNEPELDDQHRAFLEMVKGICESVSNHAALDLVEVLSKMLQHASFHFFTEEALMNRVAYPDRERHDAAHRAFEDKLMEFAYKQPLGKLQPETVAAFARSWLASHFLGEDMKLKAFLEERRSR